VETAKTTIGLDKPFAVKDQAGTVAGPLLVSTSAVVKEAPEIVSLHFDAGIGRCLQLSAAVPISSVSAGRGSRTLTERLDPSPKSMRVVPPDPSCTPGAMVTCPSPHATFCSLVSKPKSGVRDEYRKIPSGGFGIPAARTACATARARARNAGVAGADVICVGAASRGAVGWVMGVAVLAPEVGAASFPHAVRVRAMRTTAGTKYAGHLAPRLMGMMLSGRAASGESLHWPSQAEYPLAPDEASSNALRCDRRRHHGRMGQVCSPGASQ
jgi:hypothetical protein